MNSLLFSQGRTLDKFQLEVDPAGMHMDLEVKAPIIIGSIPLRSTFSDFGKEGVEDIEEQETGNPIFEAYPDLRKITVIYTKTCPLTLNVQPQLLQLRRAIIKQQLATKDMPRAI